MLNFTFIQRYVPRWAVLLIDLTISLSSLIFSYYLRFNFEIPEDYINSLVYVIPVFTTVRLISFFITKIYAGVVRFTSSKDALRIIYTIFIGSSFMLIFNIIYYIFTKIYFIPYSIIIIDAAISISALIILRFTVKALYFESIDGHKYVKNIVIYGGDEYGLATKKTLERDPTSNYKVVGFVDNLSNGKFIDRLEVYGVSELEKIIDDFNVSYVILAKKRKFPAVEQTIIDICLEKSIKILRIPQIKHWINGELSFNQIKKIKIEDLLERLPIQLDEDKIHKTVLGKTVLVTGAAGSIGSEIVRQLTKFSPKLIVLLDQAESSLYDIELEILEKIKFDKIEVVIGDISDNIRLEEVFKTFAPEIVYHAAAYKHVPMMENNPYEAVKTNIKGTKNLADLSDFYNIDKFIMISTDKAVNPTNIMGASKRIAEVYIQSFNEKANTKFITTRFGNVLGSNGSVIPRFKKQIDQGGPITVTHPEITRYFMTIPEACQLVLEASAFGNGGEIFIFDMGKSVKIVDLAKKMIKLSGLKLGIDIQITFTGLRPGEKLYEELLNDKENTLPTHHPQIMIAKVKKYCYNDVSVKINNLITVNNNHNNMEIVKNMKNIIPEFRSQNSIFEKLD
ncbi:MAG: polysaccharide biosynthesis protein [Bacteroidales bacterium]|nr:polysaccharide biosynthesis protein [Bacteroidales bacterium]